MKRVKFLVPIVGFSLLFSISFFSCEPDRDPSSLKIRFYSPLTATTGTMEDQLIQHGVTQNLNLNTFKCLGWKFKGWSATINENTVYLDDGQSITYWDEDYLKRHPESANVKEGDWVLWTNHLDLIAEWTYVGMYYLHFDRNSHSAIGSMDGLSEWTRGESRTLPICTFTREGYLFTGWATSPDGPVVYSDGETITPTGEESRIDLYAVWKEPIKLKNGVDIQEAFHSAYGNSTMKTIMPSKEPPTDIEEAYLISTENSATPCYVWKEGMNILFYAEGYTDRNVKIPLPEDSSYMFSKFNSLDTVDLSVFDTSAVTNMASMFQECSSISELDVSHFDTSKVTNMANMFNKCTNLLSLDLTSFNTSNVTSMYGMFSLCKNLQTVKLATFDTSKVTDMSYMFSECNKLQTLNLSNFNTANVTGMGFMFASCLNLTSLEIRSFNTRNVVDMSYMFYSCTSLPELDLSSFSVTNLENAKGMFWDCKKLKTIYVLESTDWPSNSKLVYDAVNYNYPNGEHVFTSCDVLEGEYGSKCNGIGNFSYACVDGGDMDPGYFTKTPGRIRIDNCSVKQSKSVWTYTLSCTVLMGKINNTDELEISEGNSYPIDSFSVVNAHNTQSAKWGQSVSFQITAFKNLGLKVGDTLTAIKN